MSNPTYFYLHQKPVVEQLCHFLHTKKELLQLAPVSLSFFNVLAKERPLLVAVRAAAQFNCWTRVVWSGLFVEITDYWRENCVCPVENCCEFETICFAARNRQYTTLQWLAKKFGFTTQTMDSLAGKGQLDAVQWLHNNCRDGCTTEAMNFAAKNGHLEMVQWLHENRTEGCTTNAMDWAAMHGHLDVVQWLHAHRAEGCTTRAMDLAAANGHLDVVRWLHENRIEGCTVDAMNSAAEMGRLSMMKWLHQNRSEGCTSEAMNRAAAHGDLHIVQWLHTNHPENCSVVQAIEYARCNTAYKVVDWLLQQ